MTADISPSSFIANAWHKGSSARDIPLVDPANGHITGKFIAAGKENIEAAVAAAKQSPWPAIPPLVRAGILKKFADLIEDNSENIADADCLDIGKPMSAGRFEAGIAAGFVRYYGEAIDKANAGIIAPTDTGAFEMQVRRPRGVIAAIIPWNFPVINMTMKIAPMLAMGNTVIVKPSELSPRSACILADLSVEAGFPPGALNILPGDGATGDALARHAGVDMLAFTGSTATGKQLMQSIGQSTLKPVLLECGGKSPEIVFEDMASCDLQALAGHILQGAMMNQGQVCVARSRLYVSSALYDQLVPILIDQARAMVPGDPKNPETQFGPLASARQRSTVEAYIASVNADKILLDGRNIMAQGSYVGPTIIAESDQRADVVQEEIFGPVLTISKFGTEADAIALANATNYGLAATVWTRDLGRAHRMAQSIEAGMVKIMAAPVMRMGAGYAHSAEGCKQSGFGIEGGLGALDSFSRLQAVEFHFEDSV